ncbi:slit homolog 2 protein-like [Venturia canescens]|uniref:slit homolog 2 protein-like n=1 Tax=Venturia canescens TaxID=32260 RepID=UPI001C9C9151|nr:slit homolog 2 protein-like [Venturia canescens]
MWQRLSLVLLLVASMARSSSSSGSTSCPHNCQCVIVTNAQLDDQIDNNNNNNNNNSSWLEARCNGAPRLETLPEKTQSLVVRETSNNEAITRLVLDLEESGSVSLRKLAFVNCSLTNFNVTVSKLSKDFLVSLELTNNEVADFEELRIVDSRRLGELDLTGNRLARIKSEAFLHFGELLKLNLRRNAIETIEKNGFAGLDRLESLDLSDNRLVNLAGDTFVPLSYLKSLNISGNRLGVLGEEWFDNLGGFRNLELEDRHQLRQQPETSSRSEDVELSLVLGSLQRLETIDASRIGLERVPSALTRSVRFLNLAGNRLTLIRGGDFDSYPLLRVLDLSYNFISVVENDALGRLEILEKLDIAGNRLRDLPQSLPCGLRELILRENFIVKLRRHDLEALTKLESLILNQNNISEIEEGSMSQLLLLNELDISNNPIKQLPADTFGGPGNIVTLRMSYLVSLQWESEKRADMAFPVPAPEKLVSLDLTGSPVLAAQLLADEAALSACKSLRTLDLTRTNITELRSDLPYLLPQLKTLGLSDNRLNCTTDEDRINWLARWLREHEEISPSGECRFHNGTRAILSQLPIPDIESTSTSTTTTTTTTTTTVSVKKYSNVNSPSSLDDPRGSSEQRRITTALGAHPGILVLAAAVIGALVLAISFVISRKRSQTSAELVENYEQRRPIITELW